MAVANHLDADVFLSAPSPMLEQALAIEGRTWPGSRDGCRRSITGAETALDVECRRWARFP